MLRRQFDLPEEDVAHLDAMGLPWEAIVERNTRWVVVHEFPLPEGYTQPTASVAVQITPGYPTAQLDMAYFHPSIARRDGKPIRALSPHALDGKTWQRWSRHRSSQNPWRPGEDDLGGHLRLVEDWLKREYQKR